MNSKRENGTYWLLVTLIFLALIFFEWRSIQYTLWGARSISPVDLCFLSGVGLLYYRAGKNEGYLYPLKQALSLWYLLLPIVLMLCLYSTENALANIRPSNTRYSMFALAVYMLATGLVVSRVAKERLMTYLMGSVLLATAFYVFVYVFTRFFRWQPFLYGEGTVALYYPFGSPSQASLFLVLNLILGIGAALALKKYYLLYFVTPALVLGIFQTGSRSVAFFLVIGMIGLYLLVILRGLLTKKYPWLELKHLLLSTALATIALGISLDAQGERTLSIFYHNPMVMASGEMDSYRSKVWHMAFEPEPLTPGAGLNGEVYGMHNDYLDIWLNWGNFSAGSFLIFVLIMFFTATRLLWYQRNGDHYPLYIAVLAGLGVVFGAIYANPLLHLKFIWIYFGLIIALQLNEYRDPVRLR